VEQLIEMAQAECPLSKEEIMENILRLQDQRKLILKAQSSPIPQT